MISMKKKRALRSALAITICTVTIASVSTPVYSAPSTDELENTTSDLKGELNDLTSQLSSLSKELDTASSQVEDLAAKVEKSKLDLASAQLDEEAQYDSMKDRIKFMYEGGGASLVQILLTSGCKIHIDTIIQRRYLIDHWFDIYFFFTTLCFL